MIANHRKLIVLCEKVFIWKSFYSAFLLFTKWLHQKQLSIAFNQIVKWFIVVYVRGNQCLVHKTRSIEIKHKWVVVTTVKSFQSSYF